MTRSAGSRARDPELERRLRALPSVEEVAAELRALGVSGHGPAVAAAREAVNARRAELTDGASDAAAVEHRVGEVPLSEPSVAVAASAPHRGEAFAGAREIIDRVKAEAPIWKKEVEGDEERWVEGTPPSA